MKFPLFFPRLFRPPVFQGKGYPKNYFEGWYYKHVNIDGSQIWSIIFGISYSDDPHSFVQIIEGKTAMSDYIRFDKDEFSFEKKRLFVSIGKNVMTQNYIELDISGKVFSLKGRLDYTAITSFPQRLLSPGIMGWYSFVPFMECYHGIVSMNHTLNGRLNINSATIDFTGGKGYIEKDWGRSMPSDWIWIQCNHFEHSPDVSFMISVARIPWLRGFFPGFLSFLHVGGRVYRFATYTHAKIDQLEIEREYVSLKLSNREHLLELQVKRNISGHLKAPVKGKMVRKITESLDAVLNLKLTSVSNEILFEGEGQHAGLEIVGDISKYI